MSAPSSSDPALRVAPLRPRRENPTAMGFRGTARYNLLRRLGQGGMGVVFHAFDREREEEVALKTLLNVAPWAVFQFKQEFRALADVAHRNLVTLHEMGVADGDWFFTMELVHGVSFLQHAWAPMDGESHLGADADTFDVGLEPTIAPPLPSPRATRIVNVEALRLALSQLAEGIIALHAAGKQHRDIKPSNILVARDGRVVLLDFGLITEIGPLADFEVDHHVAGTAAYMAPEQARGAPPTPASDWYSFGVVFYEALTGVLPFDGGPMEILMAKQQSDALPPWGLAPDAPRGLAELCHALLARDPAGRPTGQEILERLGARRPPGDFFVVPRRAPEPGDDEEELIGRRRHLGELRDAFLTVRRGQAVTVHVHGASGMGKTDLVRRFLADLRTRNGAVVLEGRCYERESVPYKAVDTLIDRLTQYLLKQPRGEVARLLGRDIALLAEIFPVLDRVDAIAQAPRRHEPVRDAHEKRRRAFAALRHLLTAIAERAPLVLFVDDLQWGDLDSAALLSELLGPPLAPPILLIACFRTADTESSPLLKLLIEQRRRERVGIDVREIEVKPLEREEAQRLAARILRDDSITGEGLAAAIAGEAAGSPFFVHELARHSLMPDHRRSFPSVMRLDEVLLDRIGRLDPAARRLLDVVAVAGRPVSQQVAVRAAGVAPADREAVAVLRAARLIVTGSSPEAPQLETYHDRIRQTVATNLPLPASREVHLQIAQALEALPDADPQALVMHYRDAGDGERAGRYAIAAAERAARALAFDRAAELYRLALDLQSGLQDGLQGGRSADEQESGALRARYAEALVNAGRGGEGAVSYLAAAAELAASAPGDPRVLSWKRCASEHYLRSGRIEEGLAVLREVLCALDLALPDSPQRAVASLLAGRTRLWLRGLDFKRREVAPSPRDLFRLEAAHGAAIGLSLVDPVLATHFNTLHLRAALDLGAVDKIFVALCYEADYLACIGGKGPLKRSAEVFSIARRLGAELPDPFSRAVEKFAAGSIDFFTSEWRRARAAFDEAEAIFRERCTGVAWELASTQGLSAFSLAHLGELSELSRRLPGMIRESDDRGDLVGATYSRIGPSSIAWLAQDRVAHGRALADEAIARFPGERFQAQHWQHVFSCVQADLYEGEPASAWRRVQAAWPKLPASHLLRLQLLRVDIHQLRARAALALAAAQPSGAVRAPWDRASLCALAEADATKVAGERMKWSEPLAALLRAGVARLRGDDESALVSLSRALSGFESADMALYAAAARHRRGTVTGGDAGRADREVAERWMAGQGIARPERMVGLLSPGCG
ncbi:MAG: serine/threonine-protein kinase PknK [Myxococcales bacterium]|nr:serine/threonine-protein kinase PknK [Myxococcales bacterium]